MRTYDDKTLSYRCGREVLEPGSFKQTVPFALGNDLRDILFRQGDNVDSL